MNDADGGGGPDFEAAFLNLRGDGIAGGGYAEESFEIYGGFFG
ncbi:MAG: hypothetical protein WBY24_19585 [Candidatus Acidiferrales bacterium]